MADPLRKQFANPGKDFRSAPFWSWNDRLDPAEVRRQVRDMKAHGMGGFFMHSRVGLETRYMGPEWMACIKAAADEAKQIGMNAWLYDEDRWPSGFAGGLIDHKGFECHHKALVMRIHKGAFAPTGKELAVFAATLDGNNLVGARRLALKEGTVPSGETILSFAIEECPTDPWTNGGHYGDNMSAESVRAFLESTYEPYAKELKADIPKVVPGIFTDEPSIGVDGAFAGRDTRAIPWTTVFADEFRKRRASDILDQLPSFFFDSPSSPKVRHDYWKTVSELFAQNFSKQLGEYSASQGLAWTGHFLMEETFASQIGTCGATMPNYVYEGAPGIDILTEQCAEFLTAKQASSVAHQFGRTWVLSELYGCTGWEFTFEGMKWVGDWQYALGVTLRCPHLTLYSLRGCAKRDYPASYNYNNTWWKYNHVHEDYFARLGLMLTQGEAVRDILLVHPVASAWCDFDYTRRDGANLWNHRLESVQRALLALHRDYDFGDELVMETRARVEGPSQSLGTGAKLFVEKAGYSVVVLPPMKTLASSTLKLLEKFLAAGGKVVAVKPLAERVDALATERLRDFWTRPGVVVLDAAADLGRALDYVLPARVNIRNVAGGESAALLCQLRVAGSKRILFICNTDRDSGRQAEVALADVGEVEEWDPLTGEVRPVKSHCDAARTVWRADFAPAGSKLYVLDASKPREIETHLDTPLRFTGAASWGSDERPNAGPGFAHTRTVYLGPVWDFKRDEPNALTLDVCRWTLKGSALSKPMPVWKAQAQVRAKLGLRPVHVNHGESRWTWVDSPKDVGPAPTAYHFEFRVDDLPKGQTFLVVEGCEQFAIALNGKKVAAKRSGWYLDRSMHKVALPRLKVGVNRLVLACNTVDAMQVEDCFILGDFAVDHRTRAIVHEPETLRIGDWTLQGYLNYPGGMIYRASVKLDRKPARGKLFLKKFSATIVAVRVNGKEAGFIPWRAADGLEIATFLKAGSNRVELEVMGSPRNMLGPLHLSEGKIAWTGCGSFTTEGDSYTPEYTVWPWGLMDQVRIELFRRT